MAHLREELFGFTAQLFQARCARFPHIGEGGVFVRVNGHAVEEVRTQFRHRLRHLENVMVVHARDHDGVHLDDDAAGMEAADGFQLAFQQEFGRLASCGR